MKAQMMMMGRMYLIVEVIRQKVMTVMKMILYIGILKKVGRLL